MFGSRRRQCKEYPAPVPPAAMVRGRNPLKPHENTERLILDNRRKLELLNTMKEDTERQRLSDLHTNWHIRAERQAMRCNKTELDHEMKAHQFDIEQRRERLREKLRQEEESNINAMEGSEETTIERQAKMRARIKELKDAKERERLGYVQKMYDQQFTNSCDELRVLLSKEEEARVCAERLQQIKVKEEIKEEELNRDLMYEAMWEEDRRHKMKREEREMWAEEERRQQLQRDMLQAQAIKQEVMERDQREREDEIKLWKEHEEQRQLEDRKMLEEKHLRQSELRHENEQALRSKLLSKAKAEQAQLAFDLKMIETMQEESRSEKREREQRKKELNAEDRMYRDYLQKLEEEEKVIDREMEELQRQQRDKDYQKQVDFWRKEHQRRKALQEEVMAGRAQQVKERREMRQRQQEERDKEAQQKFRLVEELNRYEDEKLQQRRQDNLLYQGDLVKQMDHKEELDADQKKADHYEYLMCQQADKEYKEKVQEIFSRSHLDRMHPMRLMAMKNAHDQQRSPRSKQAGEGEGGGDSV